MNANYFFDFIVSGVLYKAVFILYKKCIVYFMRAAVVFKLSVNRLLTNKNKYIYHELNQRRRHSIA